MHYSLLIKNIEKKITLTKEELDFFLSLIEEKFLASGEFLLREGQVCRCQSFVIKGCLKTYYLDENGLDHIIDFSVEEWWAEDLYSLLTQTASTTNIKAIEDTVLIQINKNNLELLLEKIPKFERFFRLLFQNAYISQKEQINGMLSLTAEERYMAFLKKKPYAAKRFPQKDIASYLGVTPQFLSALRKKLHQVNVD